MEPKLDQIIYWLEANRTAVLVEYFDGLGKLRQETFNFTTLDPETAMRKTADILIDKGVLGSGRVRRKSGNNLSRDDILENKIKIWLAD